MQDAFNELNRAAFENYGGADNWDPETSAYDPDSDMYTASQKMTRFTNNKPGTDVRRSPSRSILGKTPDAQFDITITNNHAGVQNIELFNAQNTIAEFANGTDNPGVQPVLAARSFDVRNAGNTATETLIGYIVGLNNGTGVGSLISAYWAANGDLVYEDAAGDTCIISCKQIPYRSLVKYSERGSFKINKMRMKFTTSGQINNDIGWREKTFLGSTKSNTISVASYFRPDQFQSLLVDIPLGVRIDAEKGLFYQMASSETVLISMFIGEYTRSAI